MQEMRTKLEKGGIARGKTLKTLRVKTRFPDLRGGSSQEQKKGKAERDTRALNPDCGSALCVAHLPVPHVCVFIMSNSCLSLQHDQKCAHTPHNQR